MPDRCGVRPHERRAAPAPGGAERRDNGVGHSPGPRHRGAPVTEELLVNVTPRETRVAVVENGMLQEL
ncbi:hypothetical protein FPQ52_27520, partial [Klebsiella pneumoniae]